jgi:hypothetical protein
MAGMGMIFAALEQPDGSMRSPLQADLGTLLPFLLACLPAAAAAGAAAMGLLLAVRSQPAALGLAAGVQVALGLVALLQQLARGQGHWVSCASLATSCTQPDLHLAPDEPASAILVGHLPRPPSQLA